jgi:hypothetical protein
MGKRGHDAKVKKKRKMRKARYIARMMRHLKEAQEYVAYADAPPDPNGWRYVDESRYSSSLRTIERITTELMEINLLGKK